MSSAPAQSDFDTLWNYDDPAGTEAKFRELLPTLSDADATLQLKTQIARAQGLQRQFEAAHKTLDEVERSLTNASPTVQVRYLLERGRVFNSSGVRDRARPLFLQAWENAQQHRLDFFAVDAAHMLGIIEPPDEALRWNERAVALAEKSADPKAQNWLGSLYNNIGWAYYDKREFTKALEVFERDLKWFEGRKRDEQARIARYSIGKTLRALGRLDEALATQRAIEKLSPDGCVYEEIAECLLASKRRNEARPYFAQAYELLSKDEWLVTSEPKRVERLKQLAEPR